MTLAEYDAAIDKDAKGLPQAGSERPVSSIVKTIEGEAPEAERAETEAPAAKAAACARALCGPTGGCACLSRRPARGSRYAGAGCGS